MKAFFYKLFHRPRSLKNRIAEIEYQLQLGKGEDPYKWTYSIWGNIRALTEEQEILAVLIADMDYIAQSEKNGVVRGHRSATLMGGTYSGEQLKEKGFILKGITKSDLQIWVNIKGD